MALIECPECQQDVSDKAIKCPHCGFPLHEKDNTLGDTELVKKTSEARTRDNSFYKKCAGIAIGVIAAIAIIYFVINNANTCNVSGCNNTRVSGGQYCSTHTCGQTDCYNGTPTGDFYCYTHKSKSSYSSYSSYENASTVLRISNVKISSNSSYTICTGTMTNNGTKIYKFVKVKGSFKTSAGNVVDTDWTYAVGSEGLAPGESTTFRMSVSKDYKISSCSVSLLDYDVK